MLCSNKFGLVLWVLVKQRNLKIRRSGFQENLQSEVVAFNAKRYITWEKFEIVSFMINNSLCIHVYHYGYLVPVRLSPKPLLSMDLCDVSVQTAWCSLDNNRLCMCLINCRMFVEH